MNKNIFKRVSLPYPSLQQVPGLGLNELIERRNELSNEVELLDAAVSRLSGETICGDRDDTQDVELYDGSLGVTIDFVNEFEKPIGQLQWLDDLASRFSAQDEDPGRVSGERWGSGGLISNDTFITAGHCFDKFGGGWTRPSRNGRTIEPEEIAMLMKVNFNYQVSKTTQQLQQGDSYPVLELLEWEVGGLDFAIIKLGKGNNGELPGEKYGKLDLASNDLTQPGKILCLIQHPSGRPKQIEAGPLLFNTSGIIRYDSLDTEGGSSGAPILGPSGEVVGVHTNGGCSRLSGSNFGVSINTIRSVSRILSLEEQSLEINSSETEVLEVSYPSLDNIQFSNDDRAFFADQADRRSLLKSFVILLAGGSAGLMLLDTQIENGADLSNYIVNTTIAVGTDGWQDALEPIRQIQLSLAMRDAQLHLQGSYFIGSRKLNEPVGKARIFFSNLVDYYSKIR